MLLTAMWTMFVGSHEAVIFATEASASIGYHPLSLPCSRHHQASAMICSCRLRKSLARFCRAARSRWASIYSHPSCCIFSACVQAYAFTPPSSPFRSPVFFTFAFSRQVGLLFLRFPLLLRCVTSLPSPRLRWPPPFLLKTQLWYVQLNILPPPCRPRSESDLLPLPDPRRERRKRQEGPPVHAKLRVRL